MNKMNDRFKKIYTQGKMEGMQIWIDRKTGVNYLFHFQGYSGWFTPLLDEEGKIIITPESER